MIDDNALMYLSLPSALISGELFIPNKMSQTHPIVDSTIDYTILSLPYLPLLIISFTSWFHVQLPEPKI